jgi:hypothetical protein
MMGCRDLESDEEKQCFFWFAALCRERTLHLARSVRGNLIAADRVEAAQKITADIVLAGSCIVWINALSINRYQYYCYG